MQTLFNLGHERLASGRLWKDKPVLDLAPAGAAP